MLAVSLEIGSSDGKGIGMASATRDENRLSEADRDRMTGAAASVVAGWGRDYRVSYADLPTLTRIAAHSIGCSTDDLRDSELEWLTSELTKLVH